ncbi:helix-turn-helix transcriptional regulator [Arenimonas caeni]|uniref:AlpA family phage regulatory protein n=1 Tax=Arenimonas caeni TaxID=2058085 RepID=A0A2P6M8D2_9GAMM|nr:AlpA family phage regulatory protein [Arenimonas caeni]PRH82255.1 hypothetical protein C6N40_08360 [Arenimonas caeni]
MITTNISNASHSRLSEARKESAGPVAHLSSISDLSLRRGLRLPEVLYLSGLSRSAWYARLNPNDPSFDPEAPRPFKLGKSRRSPSVWWAWEVIAYLEAKSLARAVA